MIDLHWSVDHIENFKTAMVSEGLILKVIFVWFESGKKQNKQKMDVVAAILCPTVPTV